MTLAVDGLYWVKRRGEWSVVRREHGGWYDHANEVAVAGDDFEEVLPCERFTRVYVLVSWGDRVQGVVSNEVEARRRGFGRYVDSEHEGFYVEECVDAPCDGRTEVQEP